MNFLLFTGQSDHIDAGALHFVEEGETEKDNDDAYHHTGADLPKVDCALPHESEAKGFDDKNHRVQGEQPTQILGNGAERISHATGIHPELHKKAEHDLQVPEARGKAGYQTADAETEGGHLQDQDRQHNDAPAHFNASALPDVIDIKNQEKNHLHGQSDEIGNELGNGNSKPGEVNLVKNAGVGGKSRSCLRDATLEVAPTHSACQKEQNWRNIASRDFSNLVKDQREHEAGEQWLQNIPERTENCLLVARYEIAVNEAVNKVAVFHQFAPREMEDTAVRRDNGSPVTGRNGLLGSCCHL